MKKISDKYGKVLTFGSLASVLVLAVIFSTGTLNLKGLADGQFFGGDFEIEQPEENFFVDNQIEEHAGEDVAANKEAACKTRVVENLDSTIYYGAVLDRVSLQRKDGKKKCSVLFYYFASVNGQSIQCGHRTAEIDLESSDAVDLQMCSSLIDRTNVATQSFGMTNNVPLNSLEIDANDKILAFDFYSTKFKN